MSTPPEPPARTGLNARVAAEVRAELARQGKTSADLAQAVGQSQAWTTRRFSKDKAEVLLTLDDIERVARILGLGAMELLRRADGAKEAAGAGFNLPLPAPPTRTTGHLIRGGTSPLGGGRRDSVRPSSPIADRHRRPVAVRPPNRTMAA